MQNMVDLKTIAYFDLAALRWIHSRRILPKWILASRLLSHLGDGPYYLLAGLAAFLFEPGHGREFLVTGLIAFAIERPTYLSLKHLTRRNRPFMVDGGPPPCPAPPDRFSFPSGHTAAAFVMATLTTAFYPDIGAPAWLLASAIGASRIVLRVHFPTDTLAGALLGTASALAAIALAR